MTTKELEQVIFKKLQKNGTYLCFEVMMPSIFSGGNGVANERVDLLQYDKCGDWKFYELKITRQDFYSKCKHTFYGHLNYYVMPEGLYDQVKDDIPNGIGCYIACPEHHDCKCIKKAKRRELKIDRAALMFAFMQALSREYAKTRR